MGRRPIGERAMTAAERQQRRRAGLAKALEPENESEIAEPAEIEDNVLYTLARMNEHARVFKKIFRLSSFDPEAKDRINTAIERTIQKWRSAQTTLNR